MAGKFLELPEAAKLLGVTSDELIEMRSNGEIHGYRDGASWKFKMQEIERVADEKGIAISGSPSSIAATDEPAGEPQSGENPPGGDLEEDFGSLLAGAGFEDESDVKSENSASEDSASEDSPSGDSASEGSASEVSEADDDGSSILVSEESLGGSEDSTTSTIIGAGGPVEESSPSEESDLKLGDDDNDLKLAEEGSELGMGSELDLSADDASGVQAVGSGSDVLGDDSELQLSSGSGTGDLSDALADNIDDLDLGSDVDLALSEDDDLVLGASGTGSDVTFDAEGSGINLSSPADSGLSLEEEPLELGGSDVGSSLELPEDDDFIALDSMADPDEATQLKQDEEFLLSPSDDLEVDDEDSDSGSQVIALEDSEAFDEDAATMLQPHEASPTGEEAQPLQEVPEGPMAAGGGAAAAGMGAGVPGPMSQHGAAPAAMMPAQPAEAPYSIWNVLSLLAVVLVLSLAGMLMTDLIRNMWSWDSDYMASTSIMDGIVNMLGFTN